MINAPRFISLSPPVVDSSAASRPSPSGRLPSWLARGGMRSYQRFHQMYRLVKIYGGMALPELKIGSRGNSRSIAAWAGMRERRSSSSQAREQRLRRSAPTLPRVAQHQASFATQAVKRFPSGRAPASSTRPPLPSSSPRQIQTAISAQFDRLRHFAAAAGGPGANTKPELRCFKWCSRCPTGQHRDRLWCLAEGGAL